MAIDEAGSHPPEGGDGCEPDLAERQPRRHQILKSLRPPMGIGKTAIAPFPPMPTDDFVEPKGDISFTAGRDSPDEPMTGGVKLRF